LGGWYETEQFLVDFRNIGPTENQLEKFKKMKPVLEVILENRNLSIVEFILGFVSVDASYDYSVPSYDKVFDENRNCDLIKICLERLGDYQELGSVLGHFDKASKFKKSHLVTYALLTRGENVGGYHMCVRKKSCNP